MAKTDEARLKAELKAGTLQRVYFLYGEEDYFIKMYADRIVNLALGDGDREMNFTKFKGNPDIDALAEYTDSMPFFSEYKCVMITDLDPDGMDNASAAELVKLVENLPETTVLVIAQINIKYELKKDKNGGMSVDDRKLKAKTKKVIAAAEKAGCSVMLNFMPAAMAGAMAIKRAAKSGCTMQQTDAVYLAELCGRSLTSIASEVDKLTAYKQSGEITRADIDRLTPRLTDTSIFTLASELFAGHTAAAFRILDDLFAQQEEPVPILAALSSHFVDLYRAKLGQSAGKTAQEVAAAFKYPPNKTFLVTKAFNSVKRLSERYLGECIEILYDTNLKLNSSKADKRTLIEQALTQISALEK